MSQLFEDLTGVIRDVFGDPDISITRASSAADVDGWDSLMHLNVVIAIEKRFGVRFTTAEISRMKEEGRNIGDVADMIAGKKGGAA